MAGMSLSGIKRISRTLSGGKVIAGLILVLGITLPATAEQIRVELPVYGESRLTPAITAADANIRSTVREGGGEPVGFLTGFLDVGRFSGDGYETSLTNFLRDKYQGSMVKFYQPSFWEAYRGRIIATISLAFFQAALIAVLLIERNKRRQTADKLLESEKRMNLAANAAGVGMWLWNIDLNDIWATTQARAMYGIGASETINFERFLRTLHYADLEPTKKAIASALTSSADFQTQYRVIHPDGKTYWLSMQGQVKTNAIGQPAAIVGISIDITARKSAEIAAEQHKNELVRMARVSLAGQLSCSIAHELNQPLTAILANAQAAQLLLSQGLGKRDEISEILKDIVEESQRAADVIQRLRSLFNKGELQRRPLNLSEVLREVRKLMHNYLVTRQVVLMTELENDLPAVEGDRVQLQQALLNLIVNACESMSENEPDARTLTIRSWRGHGLILIEVADTGPGIDTGAENRIFDSFFTTKANGMGMGLAISRSIVEAHGGRLVVSNNSDRGAAFRFSLPSMTGAGQ
ncbi:MAG: ATP-binding protein [Methylomonas sp.]|jgi:PAS domain S-box-containing protein